MSQIAPVELPQRFHRWKSYPSSRTSGIRWLGAIPAHWGTKRLRFCCSVNPSDSDLYQLPGDTQLSFLPMDRIGENGVLSLEDVRTLDQVRQGYTSFRDEDVIVAKITPCFENGKGALCKGLANGIGFGTTELHVLRAGTDLLSGFLYYLAKSQPFRHLGVATMYGAAGQKRVSEDFVRNFRIPIPPLHEQSSIVLWLDSETAGIDTLVAKKERLIELLMEKRAVLINQAVTTGLDSSVPMRHSGVRWLGEIPEHWTVRRLKFVAKLESGHTPDRSTPEYWQNCTIPWVTLNDVAFLKEHDYISETANYINELGLAGSSARVLPARTVVLSRDATVGRCGILAREMATSQHFVDWICHDELLPEYLLLMFRVPMQQEFDRLTMGATLRTIGMPDVKSFTIPLPPLDEQQRVVSYVQQRTGTIDALLAKIRHAIDKLKEYRTALISAAVTGKIDVRAVDREPKEAG